MSNSYVDYQSQRGPIGTTYYNAVETGISNFINNEENLYQNLPEKERRNYRNHIESSYLCHGIWTKIMKNESNNKCPYSDNWFLWKDINEKEGMIFHFDIMNNPNSKSCELAAACSEKKKKEWESKYHSIGNITPIPWFKVDMNHYINGQLLHKSLDERWDLYLQLLKNNWYLWKKRTNITFEKYMILTCQQMYYQEIFSNISEKKIQSISINDIMCWNNRINENSQLVSFSIENPKEADTIVENIIKLIKIRCRVIYLLLKDDV